METIWNIHQICILMEILFVKWLPVHVPLIYDVIGEGVGY